MTIGRPLLPLVLLLLWLPVRSLANEQPFPRVLSETALFSKLNPLTPSPALMPYEIRLSFWSDGAEKRRWLRLPPGGRIRYSARGEWSFPPGALFVKHFAAPGGAPIETRLLFFTGTNVSGASYRWRKDRSDGDLLATNLLAAVPGDEGSAPWYFPSAEDCRTCHNANAGFILGVNSRQIPSVEQWSRLNLFDHALTPAEISKALPLSTDTPEVAVRSYLDVNCAFCHRPQGTVSYFDARFDNALESLIDAPVLFNQGIDRARVVAPHDPWRSLLLLRLQTLDGLKMPPLGHQRVDTNAVALLSSWIQSFPGPEVLAPPGIHPSGGEFTNSAAVVLNHPDPDVTIHFTTDGGAPGKSSPIYTAPLRIEEPTTIRARAYKEGATRSVVVQGTFLISQ